MAVKTNKEFHALQHEIAVAQEEIRGFEDRLLEFMVRADEYAAAVRSAEANVAAIERTSGEQRARIAAEHARIEADLAARGVERDAAAARVSKHSLALYDSIHRSRGVVVAEMREGRCSVCQVRLRPQVAQVIRRNDSVTQCDSCGRILYYVPPPVLPPATADSDAPPPASA
jgi:predicted  nucleic acid-binding Zn-ribbon protein